MLLFNGKPLVWVTGNPNKVSNLNTTLEQEGLEGLLSVDYDCREVLASPATIARAKAMMAYAAVVPEKFEEGTNIMVEDTSLDILGAMDWDPTLIKHNIPRLPDFIGHQVLVDILNLSVANKSRKQLLKLIFHKSGGLPTCLMLARKLEAPFRKIILRLSRNPARYKRKSISCSSRWAYIQRPLSVFPETHCQLPVQFFSNLGS